jgi:hypothetical protein
MKNVRVSSNVQGQLPAFVHPSARTTVAPSANLSYVAVMPEQFFSLPQYADKGEAALMYAVLEDALICFAKQFVENGLRAQGLAKEAERWFFSNDDRWPFSFINICLVLRMNPEYVRLGLRQWRQRRPTQIKRKKRHVVCRPRSLRVAA